MKSMLSSAVLATVLVGPSSLGHTALHAADLFFQDVAAEAGVLFDHGFELLIPIGGGGAWADFDGDGRIDLLATETDGCNKLFLNDGDGTFTRNLDLVLGACDQLTRGASIADFDNDGDPDVYLTAFGLNRLLENRRIPDGELAFVDITQTADVAGNTNDNSASATWGDYDGDGLLDLYVTNHTFEVPPPICQRDFLWHNDGDGRFTEVGVELGISDSGEIFTPGCGLAATWSDYDNDGDVDLFVVNDFGGSFARNRLFRNDGPHPERAWKFADQSAESGADYFMFGMGIAPGDFDRDGDLDYYSADIGPNNLAVNRGDGTFEERAVEAGVEASDIEIWRASGLVSWGVAFVDLDHDGWLDLLVANGGAPEEEFPGMFGFGYVNLNPPYLYMNHRDGTFRERHVAAGLRTDRYHRSLALADYDDDGDIDLYFGTLAGDNALYRNDRTLGHWLKVRLTGTVGNRDAYGARVVVQADGVRQQREIDGGSSFLARHDPTAHFGLAGNDHVDRLRVRFLSGLELELRDVSADQTLELVEPEVTIARAASSTEPNRFRLERHLDGIAEYRVWLDGGTGASIATTVSANSPTEVDLGPIAGTTRVVVGTPDGAPIHWRYLD